MLLQQNKQILEIIKKQNVVSTLVLENIVLIGNEARLANRYQLSRKFRTLLQISNLTQGFITALSDCKFQCDYSMIKSTQSSDFDRI